MISRRGNSMARYKRRHKFPRCYFKLELKFQHQPPILLFCSPTPPAEFLYSLTLPPSYSILFSNISRRVPLSYLFYIMAGAPFTRLAKLFMRASHILSAESKNENGFLITANCSPEWKIWDKSVSHTDFDHILKIIVRQELICTRQKIHL